MTARYTVPFTQEGYDKMKEELADLESKRPAYIEELRRASELGDRSENEAYKVARRRVSSTDSRIRFLKRTLDHAVIAQAMQSDYVAIGSKVTVNNGSTNIIFSIVGEHEADPANKKLSHRSPVGQALMGRKVGQEAIVAAPNGIIRYKVINISA